MRLILTADWHLRSDVPICRKETEIEWYGLQSSILQFIANMANKREAKLCIVGDIFHRAKSENKIVNMFLYSAFAKEGIYAIAGNHDLPEHSWNNMTDSSFGSLLLSERIKLLEEIGTANNFNQPFRGKGDILFTHQLILDDPAKLSKIKGAKTPQQMLDEFPAAKLICTGDGHGTIVYEKKGRLLINPGSITRQTSDQKDFKPCIFYIDTDDFSTLERIDLPDTGEISDTHRKAIAEKEERISAFVEKIASSKNITMDFEHNVKNAISESELDKDVEKTVFALMRNEKI